MSSTSRRRLWIAAALAVVVGAATAYLAWPGPEEAEDGVRTPAAAGTDSAEAAAADAGRSGNDSLPAPADGGGLRSVDLGDDADLSGEFEPPAERQTHRWDLFRDDRRVGSFRAELARGQEGMIELRFEVRTEAGTDRGSVTTVSRLFYRYARLAVEAESKSRLPLLTVLAPPALEAVLATLEEGPGGDDGEAGEGAEAAGGEPVTVDGTSGRRFSATVGDGVRIETVVVPGRLLPLRVRTTLADGSVLEARPPGG